MSRRGFALLLLATGAGTTLSRPAAAEAAAHERRSSPDPGDLYDVREADAPLHKPAVPVSFLSHDGGWITFQYPPSARDRVGPLILHADDLRAELAVALGQPVLEGVEVRVARGPDELSTLAPEKVPPPPTATFACYPTLKLAVLSLGNPGAEPADLDDSFRHELAHLALVDATSGKELPRWFSEGFATHVANEGAWGRGFALWGATVRRRLIPFSELEHIVARATPEARLAAAEAADVVEMLARDDQKWQFASLVERLGRGEGIDEALSGAYGSGLSSLEKKWRTDVSRRESLTTLLAGVGGPGLSVVAVAAYRVLKRRKRAAALALSRAKAHRAADTAAAQERARVHIVLNRREERLEPVVLPESEIPKVEHEGEWHTLH